MKIKKWKIILLSIVALIVIITGASVFAAKKAYNWFQSERFETYLQNKITEYGNIHLAFGNRSLKFLPRPQVVFHDVDIVIDDVQRIAVSELGFSIQLRSLFAETPIIDSAILRNPQITLTLPNPLAGANEPLEAFPDVAALLKTSLRQANPNLDINELNLVNGRADITFDTPDFPDISLNNLNLNAEMRRSRLTLTLDSRGSFFDGLSFKGDLDFNQGALSGNGQITNMQLAGFLPKGLFVKETVEIADCLISAQYVLDTAPAVKLDLTNLNITGQVKDDKRYANVNFTNSHLGLELKGQTLTVASNGLNGIAPRGYVTANMVFDLADLNTPQIVVDLRGRDLDIKETGDFIGVLDEDAEHLFTNIIQDGTAGELRFYIACDNFDDIFRYRKFELDFTATNATVNIASINLLLQSVTGRGALKEGWLTVSEADGLWRDSDINNANLKLDLNTEDYDFTFDSAVNFNLAGLQELLRLINPQFKNQLLDRLSNLSGRVPAALNVKYNQGREVITVISEKFNAAGTYNVGQLPVTVTNGLFTYADDQNIDFSAPNLTIGKSFAQNFSYRQDMTPDKVKSNTAQSSVKAALLDVDLNQVLPVITDITAEDTPEFLTTWQFTSGELLLKNFSLNGVIDDADTWLINAGATAKDVTAFNKKVAHEPFSSPAITMDIKTNGDTVAFNDINARFFFAQDNEVNIQGQALTRSDEIVLGLDISAPKIDFDLLLKVLSGPEETENNASDDSADTDTAITGKITFAANNAILFERAWAPVNATVDMTRDRGFLITLDETAMCGIALRGQININDGQVNMRVEPWLTDGDMAVVLACLSKDLTYAEGDISVQGFVTAKGDLDRIAELLNGEFTIYSNQGHISRFTLLANLLSIINVTEFYKGSLPNFRESGFNYSNLLLRGKIVNGNIVIEDTIINSAFFTAVASGNVNVGQNELSIDILVAPFKTVDRIVSYIPILGHIMGNNLVALPFRATGPIDNPSVIPLPPDAIGSSLVGILERTITSPFSIFDNALFDLFLCPDDEDTELNPNKQPGAGPSTSEINRYNPSGQDIPTPLSPLPETATPAETTTPNADNNDGWATTFYGPGPSQN